MGAWTLCGKGAGYHGCEPMGGSFVIRNRRNIFPASQPWVVWNHRRGRFAATLPLCTLRSIPSCSGSSVHCVEFISFIVLCPALICSALHYLAPLGSSGGAGQVRGRARLVPGVCELALRPAHGVLGVPRGDAADTQDPPQPQIHQVGLQP